MSTQTSTNKKTAETDDAEPKKIKMKLTTAQQDTLGEIGRICMDTCAATLSTLLGKRVTMTAPSLSVDQKSLFLGELEKPTVAAIVTYSKRAKGSNMLLLKKEDVLVIFNLLVGRSDTGSAQEREALFQSVVNEVMNQMAGATSTAMAQVLGEQMGISPPAITELPDDDQTRETDEIAIKTQYAMEIEDLLKTDIVQIMSADLGAKLADSMGSAPAGAAQTGAVQAAGPTVKDVEIMESQSTVMENDNKVNIKAVKYQSFDGAQQGAAQSIDIDISNNMDLIVDVPLQVTVLLGKSRKSIKDILGMNMGSVIVLDRLAGEKVDVLVNGKLFAHGEVVVIDDNYGVRITDIVSANSD